MSVNCNVCGLDFDGPHVMDTSGEAMHPLRVDCINALRARLAQAEAEAARVRAMLDEDEALRDAVRENLPECTCDSDGNLGGEVDRVEFAGEELRRALAKLTECVDKAAAIIGTSPEMAEGPNPGVVLAALDWLVTTKAEASDMNATLARDNELLSRKLAEARSGQASDYAREVDRLEAKLAQAEQERDRYDAQGLVLTAAVQQAEQELYQWKAASEMRDRLAADSLNEAETDLAAAQAERVELRKQLAQAEQDVARYRGQADIAEHEGMAHMEDAAAAQAESVRLRGALANVCLSSGIVLAHDIVDDALATPPGSHDALREMLKEAALRGFRSGMDASAGFSEFDDEDAIVSRLLPDAALSRSDERSEEGGQS